MDKFYELAVCKFKDYLNFDGVIKQIRGNCDNLYIKVGDHWQDDRSFYVFFNQLLDFIKHGNCFHTEFTMFVEWQNDFTITVARHDSAFGIFNIHKEWEQVLHLLIAL